MNDLLARLLRLDAWPSGEGVRLGFERPMPAWAWAGVGVALALFAAWSYHRLEGPRAMRIALAALRAAILLVLVVLISGPRLVESSESTERDWVVVLVDRSASLTVADAGTDPAPNAVTTPGVRVSREAQLRRAIETSWPMWRGLSRDRQVVWLGFGAGAFDLATRAAAPAQSGDGDESPPAEIESVDLGDPTGRRTSLGAALDQALRRAAARPLAGVVILSDGRSLDEPSRAAVRALQADHVPVHTLALGSATPVGDFAIRRVDGPGVAFVNDAAPVTVELERLGGSGEAKVRLIDTRTGLTIAEEPAVFPEGAANASGTTQATVTLISTPADPGKAQWAVEIVPDAPDLIPGNNRAELAVELTDRPMRALYIDGYPRWEQRYLKNLLIREKSIVSSNLLLAPDRRYTQEGDVELDILPDSSEKWAEFDAVILGDVDPGVFTETQLAQLRDHVAYRGAGLLWIAGPGATPNRWFDTPLADLLPMSSSAGAMQAFGEPVVALPTPAAQRLGVMRLGERADEPWPAELSDPATGWSLLRWAQRIDPGAVKPAAESLALAALPPGESGEPITTPLVLSMRFGAGRSLYVGTDETWRWRFGRGEKLPERFWVQMIRLLGRESLARSGRPANLVINPRRSVVEQPVRVEVELLDQSLIDDARASIAVRLERAATPGDEGAPASVDIALHPDAQAAAPMAGAQGGAQPGAPQPARRYSATWVPPEPGAWTARVVEPGMTGLSLTAEALVALPDDELRRPEADHGALARLSTETGGRLLTPESLASLPDLLPNRRVRLLTERRQTLWDTPAALILAVFLLTAEWVGRRVIRLI